MNVYRFPFALMAFLGFVAVMPAWMYWTGQRTSGLPGETQLLVGLVLPATAAMALGSWLQGG